jgi:hypothetical protein
MNGFMLGFGIVLGLFVVEFALAMRWSRSYFLVGLPIFWRRVDRRLADVDLETLQNSCATFAGTPIVFQRLGADVIAFREKPFGGSMHYFPIMRGVIRHRREEPSVLIAGLVKWWVIALVAVFAWFMRRDFLDVVPYLGGALAVLYLIQSVRFARIAKHLRSTT